MKFVYFGYDFMLDAVLRLMRDGHELTGAFSFECDNIFNFNRKTRDLAASLDIPFSLKKPLPLDIDAFVAQGCECFLSAGYLYKIPPVDENKAYAINFHPSLLPKGRGMMPTPTIIISQPQASGVTVHKMTEKYDTGDILYQEPLILSPEEDVETLSARIVMRAPSILSKVMKDLPRYWQDAMPQDEEDASTFPVPDDAMRTLEWDSTVQSLERRGRAFGRYGCLAHFDAKLWAVYNFKGWEEEHNNAPGDIVCVTSREVVIAVMDGYIVLKEFQQLQ